MEAVFETKSFRPGGAASGDGEHEATARAGASFDEQRRASRSATLLAGSREGLMALPGLLGKATDAALAARRLTGPLPAGAPKDVLARIAHALGPAELPLDGVGSEAALRKLVRLLIENGLDLSHPRAMAHLQPPPLSVAVVADALASASNASLDTYDSGPSAVAIERWLITTLTRLAALGPHADGVLTPGGSLSNLLALLLSRDAAALRRGIDVRRSGLAALTEPIVFCSELAHFSVQRACAALGLGENAVRLIPSDAQRRMSSSELRQALQQLGPEQTPLCIVATAGTTDFGSIDPLPELSQLAAEFNVWLHVDAAYGFGALFSERLSKLLGGLERADSITLDLHKLGWQPAAASVLLVADASAFAALDREVAYLNPKDDADAGLDGLLGRSLQTTRRPDALKIAATLLAFGRRGLGNLVDGCHDLARYAEQRIASEPELELVSPAVLTTVIFRYVGQRGRAEPQWVDHVNGSLRRRLLEQGIALIGRTSARVGEPGTEVHVCLKLTLLNPNADPRDIDDLIDAVLWAGRDVQRVEERVA